MPILQKVLLASILAITPAASQAFTITESFGLTINPFGSLNADITKDFAGVTVEFEDSDFFEDENADSTFFPFSFTLQPRTGGFTQLRIQSDVCEDGSCGFVGTNPATNFGFAVEGEDIPLDLFFTDFPGDIDIDEVFTIPDLEPREDGSFVGQQFEILFNDPFAFGDQLPSFSLTFQYFPEETPTVVPLPAPAVLLISALGGLTLLRRKNT